MEDVYPDKVPAAQPGAHGEFDMADDGHESKAQGAGTGKVSFLPSSSTLTPLDLDFDLPLYFSSLSYFITCLRLPCPVVNMYPYLGWRRKMTLLPLAAWTNCGDVLVTPLPSTIL